MQPKFAWQNLYLTRVQWACLDVCNIGSPLYISWVGTFIQWYIEEVLYTEYSGDIGIARLSSKPVYVNTQRENAVRSVILFDKC